MNARLTRFLKERSGIVVLGVVLIAVLIVQWPVIRASFVSPPPDDIPWRTDLTAALAESRDTGKPVLANFTASWCPPCKVMKQNVWPDASVRDAIIARYIPVTLDIDLPESRPHATAYGVTSIPTVMVLDSSGTPIRRANALSLRDMNSFLGK